MSFLIDSFSETNLTTFITYDGVAGHLNFAGAAMEVQPFQRVSSLPFVFTFMETLHHIQETDLPEGWTGFHNGTRTLLDVLTE